MGTKTWMELAEAVQRADSDSAHAFSLFAKKKSDKAKTPKGHEAAAEAHKKAAQAHMGVASYHEEMSGPDSDKDGDEGPESEGPESD